MPEPLADRNVMRAVLALVFAVAIIAAIAAFAWWAGPDIRAYIREN